MEIKEKTIPLSRFPEGYIPNPKDLAVSRYWTKEMIDIWWAEQTFEFSLYVQWVSAQILSELYPDIVPKHCASEIIEKANLKHIDPDRIRELEAKTWHDVIAINKALEEKVSSESATHINKAKTSADTTQNAKAL